MNGSHIDIAMDMTQQDCDIAKADDPLGVIGQSAEVDLVDDMHGAISASGTEDGFQRRIIQHMLQVGRPFCIGAAKAAVLPAYGLACLDPESPALDLLYSRLDLFRSDITSRTRN